MLFYKMLRELNKNKTQFISIFTISFLGIFIFCGLTSIGLGMEYNANKFYNETKIADASIKGYDFNETQTNEILNSKHIDDLNFKMVVDSTYGEKSTLRLNFINKNSISKIYICEGEDFSIDKDGIWLDYYFAKENKISIGDIISYNLDDSIMKTEVRAFIMHSDYLYGIQDENQMLPNHKTFGYGFLSSKSSNLAQIQYNEIILKTNTDSKELLTQELNAILKDTPFILQMKNEFLSYSMFKNEILQMKAVGTIFPIVFLIISALSTLTTMSRITTNQRMQIGTLKALGFSNKKIVFHYISYGLFLSLSSSILGLILGPLLLPNKVFEFQQSFYSMPYWTSKTNIYMYFIVAVTVLINIFSCYVACHSQLEPIVSNILRPKPIKIGKHTLIEKSKLWKKSSFNIQWNIRDINRNKIRSFINILGISGCMMLIICALGMSDTTQNLTSMMYGKLHKYNTKVTLLESKHSPNKDYDYIYEGAIEYKNKNKIENTSITIAENSRYLVLQDVSQNIINFPDKNICISRKLASNLNLNQGDTFTWKPYGDEKWIESKISNIIISPMGQGIYISSGYFKSLGYKFKPTSFLTTENYNIFDSSMYKSIQSKQSLIDSINSMLVMLNSIAGIMILGAVILGFVVLYNLGSMSYNEKSRELSTLKVIGFQYRKLSFLLFEQNIWLTIIGVLIGLPCGYILLLKMMNYMGESIDMIPYVKISSYLICVLGIIILSISINFLLNKKIKKIDMVSALKSVE